MTHYEVRRPRGRVNRRDHAGLIDPTDRQAVEAGHRQFKQAERDSGRLRGCWHTWQRGGLGLSSGEATAIRELATTHDGGVEGTVRALIAEALQARGYSRGLSPTLDDLIDRRYRRRRSAA